MRYFERFDATLVMEYLLTNSKRAGIPHPNRPSEKCHSRLDRESRISEKWLRYWIPAFAGMTKTHDFGVFGQSGQSTAVTFTQYLYTLSKL